MINNEEQRMIETRRKMNEIRQETLDIIKSYGPVSYEFLVNKLYNKIGMMTPIAIAVYRLESVGDIVPMHSDNRTFYIYKGGIS